MKRSIEDGDLGHSGSNNGSRCGDSAEVVRIVERSEIDEFLELSPHIIVNASGLRELLASVNDAVTYSIDLSDARDRHSRLVASEPTDDVFD
jgi:hypothetical protein